MNSKTMEILSAHFKVVEYATDSSFEVSISNDLYLCIEDWNKELSEEVMNMVGFDYLDNQRHWARLGDLPA